jgi:hypothetical protein
MTHEETERYRKELQRLLASKRKGDGDYAPDVRVNLEELAINVGASIGFYSENQDRYCTKNTPIPVLSHNIHQALQTASMIDACRTAAESAMVACDSLREVRKTHRMNWAIAAAAIVSAIAAWVAALRP